jgi:tRNA-specific 2-thiouridylase
LQIRDLASTMDLPTKARKDSQGICFLGKLKFDDFLRHYLGENPGDVVWDDNGLVVGA